MDNVDCPECNNSGTVIAVRDGLLYTGECKCMNQRRSLRAIKNSGMEDMFERYTFDSYQIPDAERADIKAHAMAYAEYRNGWFFISGQSGSGKSHICSAICRELAYKGVPVRYMLWRDEATKLKATVTDPDAYSEAFKPFKDVRCLYIDDFFKGKITEADINLAFELLNGRYNDSRKMTIISTELPLEKIDYIDEAIAGRIIERARSYIISAPNENWRKK